MCKNIIVVMVYCVVYLICTFGCPAVIISDQGRDFVNRTTDALFQKTQTQHRITSAYHPQVNILSVLQLYLSRKFCLVINFHYF